MNTFTRLSIVAAATFTILASPALADGDAAKGERVFRKCSACHSLEDGKNKVGPSLYNIVGRAAGTGDGFRYSKINKAAAEAGLIWTEENIETYLEDPQFFLRTYLDEQGMEAEGRTKMSFKLRKDGERADVAAYLKSLSQ